MSSIYGRICEGCSRDEAVISFDVVPEAIGMNPVTLEVLHEIPEELRGHTYCTGCGALHTEGHILSPDLTRKMHEVMDGRWPV